MKAEYKKNPNVMASGNIVTAGAEFHVYRAGDSGKFTDLGGIDSVEPNTERETKEFVANRRGRESVYKKVNTRVTTTLTLQTGSTGDIAVKELFYGSDAVEQGVTSTAFAAGSAAALNDVILVDTQLFRVTTAGNLGDTAPDLTNVRIGSVVTSGAAQLTAMGTEADQIIVSFGEEAGITEASAIYVQSTEDSEGLNGNTVITIYPHVIIEGTGTPDVQDFDGYEFTVTQVANTGFQPLPQFGAYSTYPDRIVYIVPNHRVAEIEDAYAVALAAYRDGLTA